MTAAIDPLTPEGFLPRQIGKNARSSFRFAMAALAPMERRAALVVYGFCRVIDDIADGDLPRSEKLARLTAWQEAINDWQNGDTSHHFSALMADDPILSKLPPSAFLQLIDGMLKDASGPPEIHSFDDLLRYCGLVSVPVGTLYLHILKVADEALPALATALGEAVQITNILRDIPEDLQLGRCYLPRQWLHHGGVQLLQDPELGAVFQRLHQAAGRRYQESRLLTAQLSDFNARIGVGMIHDSYEILHRMIAGLPQRGFRPLRFQRARRLSRTAAAVLPAYLRRLALSAVKKL